MTLSNEQRLARQLYLLELEHEHYKKVVEMVKKNFGSKDKKKVDELFKVFTDWSKVSAERISSQIETQVV